jgi:preprotein translocase subunit SecG
MIVVLFLILVVLVQGGNQGGMGAAFGGANSSGFFGATGATSLLGKLTYGAAGVFMVTSIWLTMLQGKGGNVGLREKLEQANPAPAKVEEKAPATTGETATPAAETAPATEQPK